MQCACAIFHLLPVRLYHIFPHRLINGMVFGKKVIEYKMCVFVVSTTFFRNISHFKNNSVRYYHKCIQVFIGSTRYSSQIFFKSCIFSRDFSKIVISNFIKIRQVGSDLFHADRRADMTKLIGAFRNFANAPKSY